MPEPLSYPPVPGFKALFESVPGLFLVLTPDEPFTIVAASDAYLRATLTDRAGVLGRGLFQVFPDNPEDPAATGVANLQASLRRVLATRAADTMPVQKYAIRRPDAGGFEERYWSAVNAPVLGPGGDVVQIIHRIEDVTEFIRLTARAAEQDQRSHELQARVGEVEAEVFLRAREVAQVNERLREANDELRRQVDERARAEASLHREQDFLRAVLEHAADGIVACDGDGVLQLFNRATREFHGLPEAPLPSDQWADHYDLYLPDARTRMTTEQVPLFRALRDGAVRDAEMVIVPKDGVPRHLSASGRAVFDAAGRKIGAVVVMHDLTERRLAEARRADEARRMSETRFQRLVEDSPLSTQLFWPDGRTRQVNRAFGRLFGVTLDQLADYNVLQDPELVRLGVMPLVERAFAGEAVVVDPIPYLPDRGEYAGQVRWVGAHVYPVMDDAGRVEEVVLVHFDVTERKTAEAAMVESEARFRHLAETIPQLAWGARQDGHIFWYNRRWYEYTGTTPEQMEGWGWQQVHDPAVLPAVLERWRTSIATGEPFDMEFPLRGADGAFRPFLTRVAPLRDEAGQVVQWFGTNTDVTEQRRAAEERERLLAGERAARSEAETLVKIGRALSGELDLHNLVQSATDAATELAGAAFGAFFYSVPDPQGGHLTQYTVSGVPRDEVSRFPMPRATDLFGPTLRGELIVRSDDITADPRYGSNAPHHGLPQGRVPVRSYLAVPVRSRSGEVLGEMFLGHPEPARFTERHERLVDGVVAQAAVAIDNARLYDRERSARAESERQSRMKDEFLATLSHELRTPLNAILGWSQILRAGGRGAAHAADDVRQGLEVIERNARAQTKIIEDLLDMSRIIAGKVRLDVQRVPLVPAIEAAVETVRPAAVAKGVRLQVVLDPHAGPVSADPARLQQVFWNLLSNSVKHTGRGGRVQVLLERVNSHLEVSVIDDGEGVSPEFLPHVFDRFRQADSSAARRHGGLGLGLSIVKQLVELHGGTVRAKSPGVGKGATFTVTLPLTPVHADPEPDVERRHPQAASGEHHSDEDACVTLGGVRVLVVDDEPDARALVKRLLENCEAVVTTAASASEALEALRREKPDVVISDIGMPGEDGYALIRMIRALPPDEGGDVPAVALTAYARSDDRTRALLSGFQSHVAKPVEPTELVATVASLARRPGRR